MFHGLLLFLSSSHRSSKFHVNASAADVGSLFPSVQTISIDFDISLEANK